MKKLIQILFSLPIIAAPVFSAVSCSKKGSSIQKNGSDSDGVNSLKMMSQILLSGRHENMNFNTNELISNLIMPNQAYGGIPTRFNYNNQVVDFSKPFNDYIGRMAPALGALEKNGNDVVGSYNSYIMGMYSDDFYHDFLKNGYFADTFGTKGEIGLYQKGNGKSMSILPGMNKDIHLSNEASRKELAWGIQDQGPLTNFLLNNGFDGAPAAMIPNTSGPATKPWDGYIPDGGTNCGGYMYYNTDITGVKTKDSSQDNHRDGKWIAELNQMKIDEGSNHKLALQSQDDDKFVNSKLTWTHKDGKTTTPIDFNQVGSYLGRKSGELMLANKVANVSSILSSISDTESGTSILVKFLDSLLPVRDFGLAAMDTPSIVNIITSGTFMGFIADVYNTSDGSIKENVLAALGDDIAKDSKLTTPIGKFQDAQTGLIPGAGTMGPSLNFMFGEDTKNQAKVLNQVQTLFNAIINKYNKLKDADKTKYVQTLCDALSAKEGKQHGFVRDYAGLIGGNKLDIIKDISNKVNKNNNKHDLINMLSYANDMFSILSDDVSNNNVFASMTKYANSVKGVNKSAGQVLISSLNGSDFNQIKNILGIKKGKATKGSAIDRILKIFTLDKNNDASVGADVIKGAVSTIASGVDSSMKDPYDKILRHVVTDEDWKISNVKQNFTSVADTKGKMSFTLDYTGIGDKTSKADQQTKKVDDKKLDNFNPYQTIYKYFTDDYDFNKGFKYEGPNDKWDQKRTSGVVLGKDLLTSTPNDEDKVNQALIDYDGKGVLGDNNYGNVHHKYNVEWKNVGNENTPYWVMTKVESFNVDGSKTTQFYNIY